MAMLGHAKSLKSKGNMIHVLALTDHLEGYSKARAGHAIAGFSSIKIAVSLEPGVSCWMMFGCTLAPY